ncbi:hypothetical protein JTB14_036680 [Gonioctena quinquepunctata]|nr:hypothetical protein JTB14_036680 [Gonioctena quinquepunctata]
MPYLHAEPGAVSGPNAAVRQTTFVPLSDQPVCVCWAPIIIKTDHQPLRWLMSLRSPKGRLARWALELQGYDLRIEYTPGKSNRIADMLSRPPCDPSVERDCEICTIAIDVPRTSGETLREEQLADPNLKNIISCFETSDPEQTLLLFALSKEEAVQGKAPAEIRQPLETMNGSHMPSHTHHHPDQNVRNELPGVSEMVASMLCSDLIHTNPPRVLEKAAHVLTSNFLSHSPRRRSDPKGEAVTRGLATILHPW